MARGRQRKVENKSELTVIANAKELCSYVMAITQRSPKHFRFSYVGRLQNLALDIIEKLYRANEVYIGDGSNETSHKERLSLQHDALTDIKILAYVAQLSMEQGCILPKHYEQIAEKTTDCRYLLAAWIASDKKRFSSQGAHASPSICIEM
jgi:hypothetical protein